MPNNIEVPEIPPEHWLRWDSSQWNEYFAQLCDDPSSALTRCDRCGDVIVRRVRVYNPLRLTDDGQMMGEIRLDHMNPFVGTVPRFTLTATTEPLPSYDNYEEAGLPTTSDYVRHVEYHDIGAFSVVCVACHNAARNRYGVVDDHDDCDCENCCEDSSWSYDGRPIRAYDYKPDARFTGLDNGGFVTSDTPTLLEPRVLTSVASKSVLAELPYCGMELEMVPSDASLLGRLEAAELLHGAVNEFACLKNDGSISSGFELVTQPHSLEAYKARSEMWRGIEELRSSGWVSWENPRGEAGIHIHINNRSFVSRGHAARFINFVYKNKPALVRFAGRDSHYALFNMDDFVVRQIWVGCDENGRNIYRRGSVMEIIDKTIMSSERYLAVNARNRETYELRFFRGNMRKRVILSYLEFAFALHEYTKGLNAHDCVAENALKWGKFTAWLRSQRSKGDADNFRYSNLLRRVSESRRSYPAVEGSGE
ncbi:MAG: putative amidoligase enzyme [Podoviridae sp. ctDWo9]|nr:MAG: putative amidoligase enzyme [Podoviridae sp. ctDWo9]